MSAGHEVVAFVRSPHKLHQDDPRFAKLHVVQGDVTDADAVKAASAGCAVAINCHLAGRREREPSTWRRRSVPNAAAAGVESFTMVGGLGALWAPGTDKSVLVQDWDDAEAMPKYGLSANIPREMIRKMTAGHLASMAYLASTGHPHAYMCPGAMADGPATPTRVVTLDEVGGTSVGRVNAGDVAQAMVDGPRRGPLPRPPHLHRPGWLTQGPRRRCPMPRLWLARADSGRGAGRALPDELRRGPGVRRRGRDGGGLRRRMSRADATVSPMAKRAIVVDHGGEVSAFRFARVDRAKLYGRKERVVLDEQGQPCVSAYLTADGAALVPPGGTAHVYVDDTYDTIERADLVAVDDEGQLLENVPSTLGVAQGLTPVPPERILDHRIVSVYELTAAPGEDDEGEPAVGPTLRAALESGTLFETHLRLPRRLRGRRAVPAPQRRRHLRAGRPPDGLRHADARAPGGGRRRRRRRGRRRAG